MRLTAPGERQAGAGRALGTWLCCLLSAVCRIMGECSGRLPSVSLCFGPTFTQKSPLLAPRYSYPDSFLYPFRLLRPLPGLASLLG